MNIPRIVIATVAPEQNYTTVSVNSITCSRLTYQTQQNSPIIHLNVRRLHIPHIKSQSHHCNSNTEHRTSDDIIREDDTMTKIKPFWRRPKNGHDVGVYSHIRTTLPLV